MTIGELKELFEDYDDATEVRLMQQYNWPFEYSISNAWLWEQEEGDDAKDFKPEGVRQAERLGMKAPPILYLVEGSQLGYGTKTAWNEL